MMKQFLLFSILIGWISCAALHAQPLGLTVSKPRPWHIELGVDANAFWMTGSQVAHFREQNRTWNETWVGDPKEYYVRVPQFSPSVQGRVTYAIGRHYALGLGAQYQYMRFQDFVRFEFDGGSYYNPDLEYVLDGYQYNIHRLGIPVSFERRSANGHHRLGLSMTPQILLSGKAHVRHVEKYAGDEITNWGLLQTFALSTKEDAPDNFPYYTGFSKVCLQAGIRYDYGFRLFTKGFFVGGGISYTLTPFQYRTDIDKSLGVYMGGATPMLQTRALGAQLGLSVQLW